MTITHQYIEALKTIDGWTTVSEWAVKFGELFPDLLEKANKEAENHEKPSTGLREIAARISSNISRGAYAGVIEINESEKPRKVRFLSAEAASNYVEKEIEDDIAPLTRAQRIRTDTNNLSTREKYRLAELEAIIFQLRDFFNLDFEIEHAKAILHPSDPGKHHPDNIQLLLKSHNRIKSNDNWQRFSLTEQVGYITAVIDVQRIVAKKMNAPIEDDVVEAILDRLKLVF